jgi:diguanylate cyclase (GGDEF)-like protein
MNEKFSIIVVDDDADLLQALRGFFSSEGIPCETFLSADAALEHLAKDSCDIMVADVVMPGMEGLELTERAKRIRPDLNIIVMTGHIETFSYEEAVAAGASDFIKKPFSLNELLLRIKHVRLQEKLRALSVTDELTGLPNRRGFFTLAEQQLKAVLRARRDMVLLFADLDDFKAINDTCGHQEGDRTLVAMADIFRQNFRDSDIIARMSGDEFAILLADMTEDNVRLIRKRLDQDIDAFNARVSGSCRLAVSIVCPSMIMTCRVQSMKCVRPTRGCTRRNNAKTQPTPGVNLPRISIHRLQQ